MNANRLKRYTKSLLYEVKTAITREIGSYTIAPHSSVVFLTYRCTSRCKTCSMWRRGSDKAKELDLKGWKRVLDVLADNGVRIVEFFGGDVLLRKDILIPLIRHAKERGYYVHIPFNCNLMDEKTAREVVEAGTDIVYLSMDGVDDAQGYIRGVDGSFNKIKRSIGYFRAARKNDSKPWLICNTTVSKYNVDIVDKVASTAARLGFDENDFEYVGEFTEEQISNSMIEDLRPTPYYVRQDDSSLVNKAQALTLKNTLRKLKAKYRNSGLLINAINIDLLSRRNLYEGTVPYKKCYTERNTVTVDPYGNVVACCFVNNYILGNLVKEDFKDIWNNAAHKKFRQYQVSGKLEICRYCILCVERNHSFLGRMKRIWLKHIREPALDFLRSNS